MMDNNTTTIECIQPGVVYSLPETVLNKPQPPTPPLTSMSDDLFYRLQKENALLPPQDSTAFILAQIERQNTLLEKDPKSIYIQSNELKAHFSTMQRLLKENITHNKEEKEEIDWGFWEAVIQDSEQVALKLPHLLSLKLRSGIPSKVRGLMWQAMSKSASLHLETVYEQLCKEKSPHERIIQRDLARTFPRIDMFKQENGQGQSSMKRILEAYSLYDPDVGYCQGLAFLVGPLLMNMPESQSFCVFVRIMETYEMRSMFTLNMEGLQLRLFQFSSLLSEILPDISEHLAQSGVHAAMYASQWFLTLFAYVFPINLVTRIYDIIFAEGAAETIMRVAIAMLKRSQDTILNFQEFEDILDFVTTKKLCEPYDNYSHIIQDAMELSDIITRDKMDHLCLEYETQDQTTSLVTTAGKFGFFWKKKTTTITTKKNDIKRSASTGGSTAHAPTTTITTRPPILLKKRWSSVSSRKDWSYNNKEDNNTVALEELKQQHQKTLNELLELKYDKQDLESERDALKLTIVELERRRRHQSKFEQQQQQCKDIILDNNRSFSDLAVANTTTTTTTTTAKDDDSSIMISRQHSMLTTSSSSSSSESYSSTEFDDDMDQISLALTCTTTTLPVYGNEEDDAQLVHLKVKNFELEQQIEHLNHDIESMAVKLNHANKDQLALVDKLENYKENEKSLKQELDRVKNMLISCRLENSVLIQDVKVLKKQHGHNTIELLEKKECSSSRIRRHSTTSSSMLTLVKNKRIHELEQLLTEANIKLAEYEAASPPSHSNHHNNNNSIRKKPSIYGRVLHAIKYN